jgi:hypothetical protein
VLERGDGRSSGIALNALHQSYVAHDPWVDAPAHQETFTPTADFPSNAYLGPASLPAYIHAARRSQRRAEWCHQVRTRDGVVGESRWRAQ